MIFPVRAFCTDVFQGKIEVAQEGVKGRHAMDAKANEGILFSRLEERGSKVSFLSVMIISL